nr:hypothetical protein [Tanacetum cinerariifolium]
QTGRLVPNPAGLRPVPARAYKARNPGKIAALAVAHVGVGKPLRTSWHSAGPNPASQQSKAAGRGRLVTGRGGLVPQSLNQRRQAISGLLVTSGFAPASGLAM